LLKLLEKVREREIGVYVKKEEITSDNKVMD
jgi:hypothetical protein